MDYHKKRSREFHEFQCIEQNNTPILHQPSSIEKNTDQSDYTDKRYRQSAFENLPYRLEMIELAEILSIYEHYS